MAALGITPTLSRFDTVVMGWNTYAVGLPVGLTSPYPHLRQFVVSASHDVDVDGIEHIASDPLARVRELKEEPGAAIWLCGGGTLATELAPEIDRYVFKVNPVLLGEGVPLGTANVQLGLVSTRAFESGVVVAEYVPATGGR